MSFHFNLCTTYVGDLIRVELTVGTKREPAIFQLIVLINIDLKTHKLGFTPKTYKTKFKLIVTITHIGAVNQRILMRRTS